MLEQINQNSDHLQSQPIKDEISFVNKQIQDLQVQIRDLEIEAALLTRNVLEDQKEEELRERQDFELRELNQLIFFEKQSFKES